MRKHVKKIFSRNDKWWNRISKKKSLIILGILIFEVCLLVSFWWIINLITLKSFLICIIINISVYLLFNTKIKRCNRLVRLLWILLMLPLYAIIIGVQLVFPVTIILMSFLFVVTYSLGFSLLITNAFNYLCNLNLTISTTTFITLTLGAILCVHIPGFNQWIIKKNSPFKDRGEHKFQSITQEIALYVTHKDNINFIIYAAYFVYFTISGFMEIQYNEVLISNDIDKAILKAFLVFIAYSNFVSKSKEVKIESSTLLNKIVKLFNTHD